MEGYMSLNLTREEAKGQELKKQISNYFSVCLYTRGAETSMFFDVTSMFAC